MSNIGICRVCLSGNLKLLFILQTPLQVIYEKLTKNKLITKDGRPETVCYICLSQLQRYLRLLDKSQKSEKILIQLFNSGIEIMQETVAVLNRGIKHNFCTTTVQIYSSKEESKAILKKEQDEFTKEENSVRNMLINISKTMVDSNAALCRVCLVGDVRTFSIRNTPLQAIFENLTDTKLVSEIAKPEAVCYICHCQLMKCRKFINRSRKSENILTELFRNGIQLTQEAIKIINSRIKSNLVMSPVALLSHCCHGDICKENLKQDKDMNTKSLEFDNAEKDALTQRESTPELSEEQMDVDCIALEDSSCKVCGFKCENTRKFNEHLRLHDPKREYVCEICSYRYASSSHLVAHKHNVHGTKYKCRECNKKFTKVGPYNMHMLLHTGKPILKCEKCSQIFKDRHAQKHHYRKRHREFTYKCKYCNTKLLCRQYLIEHIFNIHAQKFPHYICDICGKKFSEKSHLRKHLARVHYKKEVFDCETCGKSFSSKNVLKQHQFVHAVKKPFECNYCFKTYCTKLNLMVHIMKHTGERPFACNLCDKGFRSKYLLKEHTRTHTKGLYTCNICNVDYKRKQYLNEHVKTHTTGVVQTYACDQCGKIFSLKAELKIHMYQHKKIRVETPYVTCEICDKQIKNIREHMITHTLKKAYTCNECEKSFSRRGNFILHVKTHTGVKPFSCDICKKSFAIKASLKCHLKTHDPVKPYNCNICNKFYQSKYQLSTHMKRHFSEKREFACDQCDKKFAEKRSLEYHKTNIHMDKKKQYFICDLCFKVYTIKNDFIRHVKMHKGKSHFPCEGCKQTFSEIGTLAKHMKKHISDKTWRCTLCGRVFKRGAMCRHYLMAHKGIKPYSCNVCEEEFVKIEQAYYHYLRSHGGDMPYTCRVCNKSYTRNSGLRKHYMIAHFITDK